MLFGFASRFFSSAIGSNIFINSVFAHFILANFISIGSLFRWDDMHDR